MNYNKMASTALRLITKFGASATLTTPAGASRTVKAVKIKVVDHALLDSKVQTGDIEYLLEAGANPLEGERFAIGTDNLIVITQPDPIQPATIVVAWKIYGRMG